jgi:hypothetical protein
MKPVAVAVAVLALGLIPYQSSERPSALDQFSTPEISQLTDTGNGYWPSWAPAGDRIAFYNRVDQWFEDVLSAANWVAVCDVWIMDHDGSNIRQLWDGRMEGEYGTDLKPPNWSCDGKYLAIDSRGPRGPAYVIEVESALVLSEPPLGDLHAMVRFAPRESYVLYAIYDESSAERTVFIRDWGENRDYVFDKGGWNPYTEYMEPPPVWSRNGRLLRTSRYSIGEVRLNSPIWDFHTVPEFELLLSTRNPLGTSELPDTFDDQVTSPSRNWIVISPDPSLRGLFARNLAVARIEDGVIKEPAYQLHSGVVFSYQWHPTQDKLLFAAGRRSRNTSSYDSSDIFVADLGGINYRH